MTITDRTDERLASISEAINKDMADTAISTFVFASYHTSLSAALALSSSNYGKIITTSYTPTVVGQIGTAVVNNKIVAPLVAGDHNVEVTPIDLTELAGADASMDGIGTYDIPAIGSTMLGESDIIEVAE